MSVRKIRNDHNYSCLFTASWMMSPDVFSRYAGQISRWIIKAPFLLLYSAVFLPAFWILILALASLSGQGFSGSWLDYIFIILFLISAGGFLWKLSKGLIPSLKAMRQQVESSIDPDLIGQTENNRTVKRSYKIYPDYICWDNGSKKMLLQDLKMCIKTEDFIIFASLDAAKKSLVMDRDSLSSEALKFIESHSPIRHQKVKRMVQWLICILAAGILSCLLGYFNVMPLLKNGVMLVISALIWGTVFFSWLLFFKHLPASLKLLETVIFIVSALMGLMIQPVPLLQDNQHFKEPDMSEYIESDQQENETGRDFQTVLPDSKTPWSSKTIKEGYLAVYNSQSENRISELPAFSYNAKGNEYIILSDNEVQQTRIYYDLAHSTDQALAYQVDSYPKDNGQADTGSLLWAMMLFYNPEDGSVSS